MTSNYEAWAEGWKAAMDYSHNSTEWNYFEDKFRNPYLEENNTITKRLRDKDNDA